jgi:plasmid stabilization system protein ParE
MAYQLNISPTAIADIEGIYLEIQKTFSPERAEQWLEGCYTVILSLELFPGRCPLAPENQFIGIEIRQLLYPYQKRQVYRILFTVVPGSSTDEGVVQIHRIRHSAQDRLRTEEELQGES